MRTLAPDTRRAIALFYVGAAAILLVELAEVAILLFPPRPDVPSWRFGGVGVMVSRAATLLIADAMMLGAAILLEHRRFLRVAGILHLVISLLLLPVAAMYVLDVLALRRSVRLQFLLGFDLNALRALSVCLLGSVVAMIVFLGTRRSRVLREEPRDRDRRVLITNPPPGQA